MKITTDKIAYVMHASMCSKAKAIAYIEACEGDAFEAAELIDMDRDAGL